MELENDDVYMNTVFEQFVRAVVLRSRGGGETTFEYDAVRDPLVRGGYPLGLCVCNAVIVSSCIRP